MKTTVIWWVAVTLAVACGNSEGPDNSEDSTGPQVSDTSAGNDLVAGEPGETGSEDDLARAREGDSSAILDDLHDSAPCLPQCGGKECGDNGCGGSCGECEGEDVQCKEDKCVCKPNCHNKVCGDNGCGGSCGSCQAGEQCDQEVGTCFFAGLCTPECAAEECGPDGCGGVCGSCAPGFECHVFQCEQFDCQPDCEGKQCGTDGCGGTCGSCPPDPDCALPAVESSGPTCAESVPLDILPDDGAGIEVVGNISPEGDEDWYTFTAVDGPDHEGCDSFHVTIRFEENPGSQFLFDVFVDGCSWEQQTCAQADRFDWFVDFTDSAKDGVAGVGECPCGKDADHEFTPPEPLLTECLKMHEFLHACPFGERCVGGDCKSVCVPDCEEKLCGPNLCGGTCGSCLAGQFCNAGECLDTCHSDPACVEVDSVTCSADAMGLLKCKEVALDCIKLGAAKESCAFGEMCIEGQCVPNCTPDCAGKSCGSDGCGGVCGICPDGHHCNGGECSESCVPDLDCLEDVVLCNDAGTGFFMCAPVPGLYADNASDDTGPDLHQCSDNTRQFFVRVYRQETAKPVCEDYKLEFSNGLHPFSTAEQ